MGQAGCRAQRDPAGAEDLRRVHRIAVGPHCETGIDRLHRPAIGAKRHRDRLDDVAGIVLQCEIARRGGTGLQRLAENELQAVRVGADHRPFADGGREQPWRREVGQQLQRQRRRGGDVAVGVGRPHRDRGDVGTVGRDGWQHDAEIERVLQVGQHREAVEQQLGAEDLARTGDLDAQRRSRAFEHLGAGRGGIDVGGRRGDGHHRRHRVGDERLVADHLKSGGAIGNEADTTGYGDATGGRRQAEARGARCGVGWVGRVHHVELRQQPLPQDLELAGEQPEARAVQRHRAASVGPDAVGGDQRRMPGVGHIDCDEPAIAAVVSGRDGGDVVANHQPVAAARQHERADQREIAIVHGDGAQRVGAVHRVKHGAVDRHAADAAGCAVELPKLIPGHRIEGEDAAAAAGIGDAA